MVKRFLQGLIFSVLCLALLAGAVYYFNPQQFASWTRGIADPPSPAPASAPPLVPSFPALAGPTAIEFTWTFDGHDYQLPVTLYRSTHDYYEALPHLYTYVGQRPDNWEETYFRMFLTPDPHDDTLARLATQLQALRGKHGLDDDKVVDLILAFVQAIPYDNDTAKKIIAGTGTITPQYPYETLFRRRGVCTDKSLLAAALLRHLGYGTALFSYDDERHMSVAVQCPAEYSNYASGYCYAETTSPGHRIGVIPDIDRSAGKAVAKGPLAPYNPAAEEQDNLTRLGAVDILCRTTGRSYTGIIQTRQLQERLATLTSELIALSAKLETQRANLSAEKAQLDALLRTLEAHSAAGRIAQYNALVPRFNAAQAAYNQHIENFNRDVAMYNQLVASSNQLIKQI